MPLYPSWEDIAVRIVLTLVAGSIIGFNRGVRGHAAGLRTTILVGLAAAVAMIQSNILLSVAGKTASSFGVMDLMRLPLGILTGVGFIGAGTILRKGDLVTGVTTAATLWVVTVIGLCFGGGQLALGGAATIVTVLVLWALVALDIRIPREHRATFCIRTGDASFSPRRLTELLAPLGCSASLRRQQRVSSESGQIEFCFEVSWRQPETAGPRFELLDLLNGRYTVVSFELTSEDRA